MSDDLLMVGAARADITPPMTIPYLGFAPTRHRCFQGVHDRLFARAVVAGDGDERIALVVADALGLARRILGAGRDFIAEVRRRIQRSCEIAPDHVMIAATHAHSTPETAGFRSLLGRPGAEAWLEGLADQLASAVVGADGSRAPARLKIATGRAEGIGHCRRIVGKDGKLHKWASRPPDEEVADWGANDPQVTVLAFESPAGARPETAVVHFTAHPVTVQAQPLVSADFPGEAIARIRAAGVGCEHCLYLQGAAGSIGPVGGPTRDFVDVARYGRILADEAVRLLGFLASPGCQPGGTRIGAATEMVTVPSRPLPDAEDLQQERRQAEDALRSATTPRESQQAERVLASLAEQAERVSRGAGPFEAEVQVLRIGDAALVGIPGEPFAEMGLEIKAWPEAPTSLCVGYANDYLGYIAPPAAWQQGGYEVSLGMWSILGPEAYEMLLRTGGSLIQRLFKDDPAPLVKR